MCAVAATLSNTNPVQVSATDDDGDPLTYSMTTVPNTNNIIIDSCQLAVCLSLCLPLSVNPFLCRYDCLSTLFCLNIYHCTVVTACLSSSVCLPTLVCLKATQWGAADAEIKAPSVENTELKRSPFKAWSRSVFSHTCYVYCQGCRPC